MILASRRRLRRASTRRGCGGRICRCSRGGIDLGNLGLALFALIFFGFGLGALFALLLFALFGLLVGFCFRLSISDPA